MFPPPADFKPTSTSPPTEGGEPLVPLVDEKTLTFAAQQALLTIPFKRNLLSTLGHAQGLFVPLMGILGGCFDGRVRTLPGVDWQLIVLRIGKRLDAGYVFHNNAYAAFVMGMPQEKIDAFDMDPKDVVSGKGPWTKRDRLILRVVDEQLKTRTNEERTIKDALKVLTVPELVEVLIIYGTYGTFAAVVKGLRVAEDSTVPGLEAVVRDIVTTNFVIPKQG